MRIITTMEPNKEIKSIRNKLSLSQREIAAIIGTNRNIYADYEIGRTRLPADIYIKIKALYRRKKNKKGQGDKTATA